MEKILFSPIGNSDPIRGNYDGAWLHICRHYQPTICEIYLSAQMCIRDEEGDIYAKTLQMLNERLFCNQKEQYIQLRKTVNSELVNAHSLEIFFPIFRERLTKLHEDYPGGEILVNVSSGTPGMKNTLMCLYHLLPFPIKLIQVDNPSFNCAPEKTVDNQYDVETEWELNCDNEENAVNRCSEQHMHNLNVETRVQEIMHAINNRQYTTAYEMAKKIKEHLPDKVFPAIEGAVKRSSMSTKEAGTLLKEAGWDFGEVLKRKASSSEQTNAFACLEFYMTMDSDFKANNYAEYLRKITPLLCDICELLLLANGFNVYEHGVYRNKWHKEKMSDEAKTIFDEYYGEGRFNDTMLSTANMIPLIKAKCNQSITALVSQMRSVEELARNTAAHEISAIDRAWISSKTNMEVADIHSNLRKLVTVAAGLSDPFAKEYWGSYNAMNKFICDVLSEAL